MKTRIVFMGTPAFSVPSLRQLLESAAFEVVAVVTQPDRPAGRGRQPAPSPVKALAQQHDVRVLQPERLRRDPETVQALRELAPDVIVVAAYGAILPPAVLEIPTHGCVNVHASLLPAHRGAAPVAAALLNGDEETGATIMLMDEGLDHGPILAQRSTPIRHDDTQATLTERLAELGAELLGETLPQWLAGQIRPQPQDHDRATYAPMLRKEDGEIDWTRPAAYLARMVRAFDPWPGAYTCFDGRLLKVVEARATAGISGNGRPGEVVETDHGLVVAAGEGALLLKTVQLAGKRPMEAGAFARGQRDFVGSILGV